MIWKKLSHDLKKKLSCDSRYRPENSSRWENNRYFRIRTTGPETETFGKTIGIFEFLCSHANHVKIFCQIMWHLFLDHVKPLANQISNGRFYHSFWLVILIIRQRLYHFGRSQGSKVVTLLESRIKHLVKKVESAMKKHTSSRPWNSFISFEIHKNLNS